MSGITGNAGPVDPNAAAQEFSRILSQGERVFAAFEFVRDAMLFTNGRLIFVDKQGVTGKKIEYKSIPYRSISHFSVQTAGHLDSDAEMFIWLENVKDPIEKQFNSSVDIYQVQSILAAFVVSR